MTPSGIEPAAFRFVAQYLNHCATAVPNSQILFRLILSVKFPIINKKDKLSMCLIKHHSIMTRNYMEVNGDFCALTPMEEALNWRLSRAQSYSKCCGEDGSLLQLMGIEG
jgi:hypothetical protein